MSQSATPGTWDPPSPDSTGPSLFDIAWRWKSLLALGGAVGLVLGAIYYSQKTPVYQSSADILVVQKQPMATPMAVPGMQAGANYLEDYVAAHSRLIQSPLIVNRAIATVQLPSHYTADGIVKSLKVDMDSNVLLLSIQGLEPADCQKILAAVISSYESFLDETYKNVNEDSLKQITEKAHELQTEIQTLGGDYQKFLESKPVFWDETEGPSLYEQRLAAIETKRSELRIERADTQSQMAILDKALQDGADREALLAMVGDFPSGEADTRNPTEERRLALERELLPLVLREQQLAQDYGAQHPDVKAVRQQLELTRQLYAELLPEWAAAGSPGTDEGPPLRDPVAAYRASLERRLQAIDATDEKLAELAQAEQDSIRELSRYGFEDKRIKGDLSRAEKFYDGLITQLQGLNLGKDLGGFQTSVLSPPELGVRVAPHPMRVFPAALLLGLMSGFGLAYLAEITDKRFRTPEDIRQHLGLPVVGQIPFLKPHVVEPGKGPQLDPMLCVYHHPRSVSAEAFRGVRTAIYFSARGEEHRVLQVTSPSASDGKSTLASNLAVALATAGNRVLLVDADMRKARQHTIFAVANDSGLASVLAGQAEPVDAIQDTAVDGLRLLPAGPHPSNPAELLVSPRFVELLALVRGDYDYVIVDTPPVLAVTDPSVIAPRVDGVLLAIRITKHGSISARRAKEMLDAVDAELLGVVVNEEEGTASHFGYGKGYGYGYGRYGYGRYGYGGYGTHTEPSGEQDLDGQQPPSSPLESNGAAGGAQAEISRNGSAAAKVVRRT